ncbi:MAG: ABC transporter ATP-binding protein [Hyphomicrobiales bacterium]
MNNPAIELRDVHLTLGEGAARVHILKGVSLSVPAGEAVGLVGPSGSGKSTLLMVTAGLERADSGTVKVAGEELGRLGEDALARFRGRRVGIVFQSFHLVPNMTALENVAVPLELAGAANAFERARAELEAVGLGGRLSHYPAALSGGEQQRVAIARALVADPAILIADEPTGNLDEGTGEKIVELLFAAQARRHMTLFLVTHDLRLARRCGRIVRLKDGGIDGEELVAGPATAEPVPAGAGPR